MENSAPERQQVRVTILSRPYTLLTTDKDHVRLAPAMKAKVMRLSVEAKFEDEALLAALLDRVQP